MLAFLFLSLSRSSLPILGYDATHIIAIEKTIVQHTLSRITTVYRIVWCQWRLQQQHKHTYMHRHTQCICCYFENGLLMEIPQLRKCLNKKIKTKTRIGFLTPWVESCSHALNGAVSNTIITICTIFTVHNVKYIDIMFVLLQYKVHACL